jgi:hypothetical protein
MKSVPPILGVVIFDDREEGFGIFLEKELWLSFGEQSAQEGLHCGLSLRRNN